MAGREPEVEIDLTETAEVATTTCPSRDDEVPAYPAVGPDYYWG